MRDGMVVVMNNFESLAKSYFRKEKWLLTSRFEWFLMIEIQLNDFNFKITSRFDIMTGKSVMNIYYNFLLDFCSFLTKSKGFTFDLSDLLLIRIVLYCLLYVLIKQHSSLG